MSVTDFPVILASNTKEWCDWMGGRGGEREGEEGVREKRRGREEGRM